jgi:ABC-type transport system involved in cytochrome c biogenesis permease subunit
VLVLAALVAIGHDAVFRRNTRLLAAVLGMAASHRRRVGSGAISADRVRDTSIALGFVSYATGGLVFGAIWAEAAWGRFWGWDPKETWALVTTIHRVLAIVAWVLAVFTFFGVNYLMSGLHSYA